MRQWTWSLLIAAGLFTGSDGAFANGSLQYEVTSEGVESASVHQDQDGSFDVAIKLTDAETRRLSRLTKENVGRELEVVASGQVILRVVIRAEIDSGLINIGRWKTEAEAQRFAESLQGTK
jgi:preprotein translocase subunit SecD